MKRNIDRTFEAMALPHLNALYQTALKLTRSRREADLAIQEIYAEAWKEFRRGIEWAEWRVELFKILCQHVDGTNQTSSSDVAFSLEEIPVSLRKPVLLIDCQGFTYKQASEILGVPVEIVADRLSQGRDQIGLQTACGR